MRITDQTGVYNWQASLGFDPDDPSDIESERPVGISTAAGTS